MHGGKFRGRQPESLTVEEWQEIETFLRTGAGTEVLTRQRVGGQRLRQAHMDEDAPLNRRLGAPVDPPR